MRTAEQAIENGKKITEYRKKRIEWLIDNQQLWFNKRVCPNRLIDIMFDMGLYGEKTKKNDVTVSRVLKMARARIEKAERGKHGRKEMQYL